MDGMLSQEEINALLGGMSDDAGSNVPESSNNSSTVLTTDEKDVLGEISNICMGTAATTLYSLVNQKVTITTPEVTYCTWDDLAEEYVAPCVFINIAYVDGIDGNNLLILKEDDVKVITDLMMGGDGTNLVDELTDLHLSAICEAMNQMMGSSATSMSSMLNRKIDISPPVADVVNLAESISGNIVDNFKYHDFVRVSFKMEIGDLVDSNIMQLYPYEFAKDLYHTFMTTSDNDTANATTNLKMKSTSQSPTSSTSATKEAITPMPQQPPYGQPVPQGMMSQQMPYGQSMPPYGYGMPTQDVNVQPVQFQNFVGGINPVLQQENIDLIMDVPLEVTVELGRTKKSIKDILEFAPGTIIELDKIAGEPIDVLVNGKLVAKGEVVVIEESFGIRVTEIVKQKLI